MGRASPGLAVGIKPHQLLLALLVLVLVACTSGNCRRDGTLIVPKATGGKAVAETPKKKELPTKKGDFPPLEKRVFVFKDDGSKQCGMGKTIPLKVMARELKGIKIYSQENKMDGLMHIQVCGAATGRANVYEISKDNLGKAKAKGFTEWTF